MACHGVPKVLTTDGGPPYNGHEFAKFARRMGFRHRTVTPEDPRANGFAEAFVKVMVKLIQTAAVEGRDPRKVLSRHLLIYRAAPHRMTGKSPAELLMGRPIQTRLPQLLRSNREEPLDTEVRQRHEEERRKQKAYADKRNKAVEKDIQAGDKVMCAQKKTNTKTP